ncbi:hypothetical protein APHAL10511_000651 [Amanita phalloides]|nr:hypothetical protein APHAL10511_000651 [Amanita phalloides]
MRIATGYIPHALYAIAVTSISIHLVNKRRVFEDEKASVNARISILESIAQQSRSGNPADEELERLKRLARPPVKVNSTSTSSGEGISWKEVMFGRRRPESEELSHWEKKDLEKFRVEVDKP